MVTMHSPSKRFFVAVGNIINIMTVDLSYDGVSLVAQLIKNPPAMWETWVGKIPWRRAWQPTPLLLPEESPWTEEPGGLQSMGSQRVIQLSD